MISKRVQANNWYDIYFLIKCTLIIQKKNKRKKNLLNVIQFYSRVKTKINKAN